VILVLDASVIIKWLLKDPERETGTEKATQIMELVAWGELGALQPVHWLAEVGAVLARESPATAANDVTMLFALELPILSDPLVLRRAVDLAIELRQHVFDTLYHAVALEIPDATLVTADNRYLRAARGKGRILDLLDWVKS
jgi:predicted nucleic acid-binding protein